MSFLHIDKKHWGENVARVILFLYVCLIIKLIVFKYPTNMLLNIIREWSFAVTKDGLKNANYIPFKSIRMYIAYYSRINGFENLFGNLLVFIPFGMLIPFAYPKGAKWWAVTLWGLTLSLAIEVFQLITHFGVFDVDDILLNTLGALLGYFVFVVLKRSVYEILPER